MPQRISEFSRRRIQEKMESERVRQTLKTLRQILEFKQTPMELKAKLDQFLIGQEDGKKIMATAIAFHYRRLGQELQQALDGEGGDLDAALRRVRPPKANILIIGPTGCGKTYTSETASSLVGVPFVVEDMTKFSETGYVGRSTSDILADLLIAADGNADVAQMGIVYLDEIDKIASQTVVQRDVSGQGVQKGLLRLVEGVENTVELGQERYSLSTRHVLFIAGGVFDNLEQKVKTRMARSQLAGPWQDYLLTDDLVAFGMERQLMGRFPVRVVYHPLTADHLKDILLKSADSPLAAFASDLKAWDIDLQVTDEALDDIARRAVREKTGARGLIGILHRALLDDLYRLPGAHRGELRVDRDYVRGKLG
jgi:ATP-dependent Clp protease ATP-binding subunit ClpX